MVPRATGVLQRVVEESVGRAESEPENLRLARPELKSLVLNLLRLQEALEEAPQLALVRSVSWLLPLLG